MIVLTAAVVLPMIQKAGFDLIWFGIFIVLLVEIAEVTPPVGFNLFVLQNMTGKDSNTIARAALPFFAMLVAVHRDHHRVPADRDLAARPRDGRRQVSAVRRSAAKLRTPFAVLGIANRRSRGHAIRYLPLRERAQRPAHADRAARRRAARALSRRSGVIGSRCRSRRAAPRSSGACGMRSPRFRVGESRTYAEIARTVRSSARAVGGACGANRIALVIPCHRVVGSRGALGGFMNAARRRHRDQALAARPRRLSVRRVSARDADAAAHRRVLRPALAAGRPRAGVARRVSARSRRVVGVARASAGLRCSPRPRATSRPGSPTQFAAKAKATSIARRLSTLRRFYRLAARARAGARGPDGCACSAPKRPRRLPKNLSEKQVEALLAAPDRRPRSRPARPRDARDALRVGTARLRARRTSSAARSRSTPASFACSARAARSGSFRSARRRSTGSAAISSRARPALAGDSKQRPRVRDRARRADDAPGVLGADQALRDASRASRPQRCRRTCCATRSRRIC